MGAGVPQLPLEQTAGPVYLFEPLQDAAAPHETPEATWVQAPAPSQVPVLPHVPPPVAHWPAGAAVPGGIGAQVPGCARLQAWQVPQVLDEQQTSSVQKPLMHSCPVPQAMPDDFLVAQLPPVVQ
jgi:hypothetical protein